MSQLKKFNPYDLPEETLLAISTGRERVLESILATITRNAEGGAVQHLQVVAPRGYGKSFLMRLVQSALKARAAEGKPPPIVVALLPEEQHNVDVPHRLLNEIQRVLENRPASSLLGGVFTETDEAWDAAVAALESTITLCLPDGQGIVVAIIENFDQLMNEVFRKPRDQSRLRALLTRPSGRLMLLATSTRRIDSSYEQRLFHATGVIELMPWKEDSCLSFFERLRGHRQQGPMSQETRAKAQAVAEFIGGSPRMATALAEVLDSNDSLRAAEVLDGLVDELTPYYKHRIESLSRRARTVLDALLRMGEPRTQSELAVELKSTQARIAEPFSELRLRGEVTGLKAQQSAEVLYRVADRLMVHYYRRRHLGASLLEAITEFLTVFYSTDEKLIEAGRLRALGRTQEAAHMERLVTADRISGMSKDFSPRATGGWLNHLWERLTQLNATGHFTEAVTICQQAVHQADSSGGKLEQARSRLCLGWSLGEMGRHTEAVDAFRQASALFKEVGDLIGQAAATRNLGWSLGEMGRHTEAVEVLRQASALFKEVGDLTGQATATRNLGWSLNEMGRHTEAVDAFRQASALFKEVGDLTGQAAATRNLGWSLNEMGRHTEAVDAFRQASALFKEAGNRSGQAAATLSIGWSLGEMGRHTEAVDAFRQASALFKEVGDLTGQATATRNLGWSLGEMSRHGEAVDVLHQASALAEEARDLVGQTAAIRGLVWSLYKMNRHAEAVDLLHRAIALAEQINDTSEVAKYSIVLLILAMKIEDDTLRVIAWQRAVLAAEQAPTDDKLPNISFCFGEAAAAALRTGRFGAVWLTTPSLIIDHEFDLQRAQFEIAETIAKASLKQGRAAAYALAADWIEVLSQDAIGRTSRAHPSGPDPITFLRGSLPRLIQQVSDPALLRDIAALLEQRLPSETAADRALLEAAARRTERPNDPAALERIDPDVITALERVLGIDSKPASKSSPRTSKRSGTSRRKK
ncbi:tetratricopeptide repeat protein [Pyxidicoccus fallax]|uniref:Tetratricopeptide repeat protein n=1 Tax=Pyxidicoccus fallax TaxID=394095 RepID=A0A848LQV8_9BACT|nr:tetratricopeptide repeat protein [Pyxidicoccus fallax]NMO20059.1 tetratricopeptide repeat protein [Pyxidicoccus fallax]NPC81694.1 tetratricopeptide repeat protein [Pyxidicoccus fallax]